MMARDGERGQPRILAPGQRIAQREFHSVLRIVLLPHIDVCIEVWKKYDPDHRMELPLGDALKFITEVLEIVVREGDDDGKGVEVPTLKGQDLNEVYCNLDMKYARALVLNISSDNKVSFLSASKQVLRFTVLTEMSDKDRNQAFTELDMCDINMSNKERTKLERLERN